MTTTPGTSRQLLRDGIRIDIDGTFTAKIEIEVTPDIAIERHLHLRRDPDAGWFLYSIPGGAGEDDATAEIVVNDPAICAFLDALYHLIADSGRFGTAEFGTRKISERT